MPEKFKDLRRRRKVKLQHVEKMRADQLKSDRLLKPSKEDLRNILREAAKNTADLQKKMKLDEESEDNDIGRR